VLMCHKPDTSSEQTIYVPQSAVDAHLDHGDIFGPCPPCHHYRRY
jgi:hypothetical protein